MPEVSVRKEFGPFTGLGGQAMEVEGDHELDQKMEMVIGLLGQIKILVKRFKLR